MKIKTTTDPETKNFLIRKALEEKMKTSWGCFKKDPKKSENCRKLLLFLIKTKIVFPEYKRNNPKITKKQMEALWNAKAPAEVASPKSRSSPDGLIGCPNCRSDNIVFAGFDGSTAICQNCGISWQILGGKNNVFVSQSSTNKIPTIQAYVDSKGNEIDPEFPKVFGDSDSKEKYLQKSIKELHEILKRYSKEWEFSTWNIFIQRSVFYWVKYLESLPPKKGMPKKIKRTALLAVLTYYAGVVSNRNMSWKKISEIFGVLEEEMDRVRDKEIEVFWTTPGGSQINTEVLEIAPKTEKVNSPIKSELLTEIKKDIPRATQLGLDAFLSSLDSVKLKPPPGTTVSEMNKQKKVVESWFDENPSFLAKVLSA